MEFAQRSVPVETAAPSGRTNAYVLGDDPALLVDPAGRTPDLDRLVADKRVEHVLVTHTHPDHVGALEYYAAETGATVWARRPFVDRFRSVTGLEPDRLYGGDTTIDLGDDRVRILDAPGHAPDHVALVAGVDGPILCGDCAVREGSVVVGAPEGDLRAYLSTLRRLRAIDPPRLHPGHGPVIERPRETLERLIAHRLARERRVLEAVETGSRTLESVLEAAYEKDVSDVQELARATVRAHLEKLAVEGRVRWDGDLVCPVEGRDVR